MSTSTSTTSKKDHYRTSALILELPAELKDSHIGVANSMIQRDLASHHSDHSAGGGRSTRSSSRGSSRSPIRASTSIARSHYTHGGNSSSSSISRRSSAAYSHYTSTTGGGSPYRSHISSSTSGGRRSTKYSFETNSAHRYGGGRRGSHYSAGKSVLSGRHSRGSSSSLTSSTGFHHRSHQYHSARRRGTVQSSAAIPTNIFMAPTVRLGRSTQWSHRDIEDYIFEEAQLEEDEELLLQAQGDGGETEQGGESKKKKAHIVHQATVAETFSFGSTADKWRIVWGAILAGLAGISNPASSFALTNLFASISGPSTSAGYLDNIAQAAYIMMGIGVFALVTLSLSSYLLETAASNMTLNLSAQWFAALLRQDMAYHDLQDVSGAASLINAKTSQYARGVGRKMGEGIMFTVAVLGGIAYALYSSWQVTLVVIAMMPLMVISGAYFSKLTREQNHFTEENYAAAGSVVYMTVLCIRTVLALNAVDNMISQFKDATERGYTMARDRGWKLGAGSGMMMASFQLSYVVLTLFGCWLIYDNVRQTGCNPGGSQVSTSGNDCTPSGSGVFGAFLGLGMAGAGIPIIGASLELFTKAQVAIYPGLCAINRKLGAEDPKNDTNASQETSAKNGDEEMAIVSKNEDGTIKLPPYRIDSSSPLGLKPAEVKGEIEFKNIHFTYPARANKKILNDFNLTIKAGQTVALVGPSGGGKSTIISLLERFYDANQGSVLIDGEDITKYNVKHLREKMVGLVQQEPKLFATSIAENIRYGKLDATQEEIETACKLANAHDFISNFPDGYKTEIAGAQLSGGQKQRVCIARTLMKQPAILLLDEATSALDSESELIVQQALDSLLEKSRRTTIIIAHRLSTIRNADMIVYVAGGAVMETGNHDELMAKPDGLYKALVETGQAPEPEPEEEKPEAAGQEEQNAEDTRPLPTDAKPNTGTLEPLLNFRNVKFAYPKRPNNIIFTGLDLTIHRGETVALVGPSGQGKSTIVQLLERFYDPLEGTVDILGTKLPDINVRYLRDQIGLVEQEPSLFAMSIADNIAYGSPGASREAVIEAAELANAHGFISSFPDGYDTDVGRMGGQLSGGQRQRIAIARAILKKPQIILLDEATSALDSESQHVVQEALDKLAQAGDRTTLVIAHRLSTIRKANRVAYIADGRVQEIGGFAELMAKPNGKFKRLYDIQNRRASTTYTAAVEKNVPEPILEDIMEEEEDETEDETEDEMEDVQLEEPAKETPAQDEKKNESVWRFVSSEDYCFFVWGFLGATMAGLVFPAWGVLFALTLNILFYSVETCDEAFLLNSTDYASCQDYWDYSANDMAQQSFYLTYGWIALIAGTILGNAMLFYGFGGASEQVSKRVRDQSFEALVRQEVGYFDVRDVGEISSCLFQDAALLQAFLGDPLKVITMNIASVAVAVVLALYFMWPLALMFLGVLPFMSVGTILEAKIVEGDDAAADAADDDESGPAAVALESMTYIRTVASLSLEEDRFQKYMNALNSMRQSSTGKRICMGVSYGLSQIILYWSMALLFWWGGYLIVNFGFDSVGYNIAFTGLAMSMNGLAMASSDLTNKVEATAALKRIVAIIDRKSTIDPLSEEGKKEF